MGKWNKWLVVSILIIAPLNYLMHSYIHYGETFGLDVLLKFDNEFQKGLVKTVFVGMPLVGLLIGMLLSFIPFRNLKYNRKILFAALCSTLVLQIIYFVLGMFGQIFK